jgi:hypothetical protein
MEEIEDQALLFTPVSGFAPTFNERLQASYKIITVSR